LEVGSIDTTSIKMYHANNLAMDFSTLC